MRKFFQEFKTFALRGNVIDLAVGVIIGAAFQSIVTSLTENILAPLINLVIKFVSGGSADAADALAEYSPGGFGVGAFVMAVISFLLTAFVVFLIVKLMNRLSTIRQKPKEEPKTKKCPFCYTDIDVRAVKCPNCTADLNIAAT